MTVHSPTVKQLQYLVALRQHGHFGKAAEACYVTQSTLSAGLRELETLLGLTLVERTRRVVRFTTLGEKIADKATTVLRETEELAEMARAQGRPLHGELRMGVIPTIAPFLLPTMLPRLRELWPELKLYLREETSNAACDALPRRQLDCVRLAHRIDLASIEPPRGRIPDAGREFAPHCPRFGADAAVRRNIRTRARAGLRLTRARLGLTWPSPALRYRSAPRPCRAAANRNGRR